MVVAWLSRVVHNTSFDASLAWHRFSCNPFLCQEFISVKKIPGRKAVYASFSPSSWTLFTQVSLLLSFECFIGPMELILTGLIPQNPRIVFFMALWPGRPYTHLKYHGGVSIVTMSRADFPFNSLSHYTESFLYLNANSVRNTLSIKPFNSVGMVPHQVG